jgi:hypothetical protein
LPETIKRLRFLKFSESLVKSLFDPLAHHHGLESSSSQDMWYMAFMGRVLRQDRSKVWTARFSIPF